MLIQEQCSTFQLLTQSDTPIFSSVPSNISKFYPSAFRLSLQMQTAPYNFFCRLFQKVWQCQSLHMTSVLAPEHSLSGTKRRYTLLQNDHCLQTVICFEEQMKRNRSELHFPMFIFNNKKKCKRIRYISSVLQLVVHWLSLEKVHWNGEYSLCAFMCLTMPENYLDPQLNRFSPLSHPMDTAWAWQVDLGNWFGILYHLHIFLLISLPLSHHSHLSNSSLTLIGWL